jgi:hypothetical protein
MQIGRYRQPHKAELKYLNLVLNEIHLIDLRPEPKNLWTGNENYWLYSQT